MSNRVHCRKARCGVGVGARINERPPEPAGTKRKRSGSEKWTRAEAVHYFPFGI